MRDISVLFRDIGLSYGASYKKLTFYARHTGTGTGVLRSTDGCAMGTDTGVASA